MIFYLFLCTAIHEGGEDAQPPLLTIFRITMETSKFIEDLYQKVEAQQKQIDALLKKCYLNKKVLTLQEAHEYTGLSTSYLYRLTSTNQIAHFKPSGKLIFFEKEELENWLMQNRVKTQEEIEQEVLKMELFKKLK